MKKGHVNSYGTKKKVIDKIISLQKQQNETGLQ